MNVNTRKYTICPSLFLLARRKSSSAIRPQFTRNRRFEIVPKSLFESKHTRGTKSKKHLDGEVRKGEAHSRASKTGHSVEAESHRRSLGVDSLLIHHETKRNYFTHARQRARLSWDGRSYSKSATLCRGLVRLSGW